MGIRKLIEESRNLKEKEDISILIVDDDPIVLEVLKGYIQTFGYTPTLANDGQEAIERLNEKDYHIVITDINMPRMDGMELLKHTKKYYPDTGVIVVTGFSEEYTYVDVIKAGAIDYISKPFVVDELLAKLHRVIREQNLVRQLQQISIRDALTGIYNRRYFDRKIVEELHRATRQNYAVFLALVDIDDFKGYNDTYGHLAGDALLVEFGGILSKSARYGVDYAFRYGGDEFAAIYTQIDELQAQMILERIMTSYLQKGFTGTSLSFGLAQFVRDEECEWEDDIQQFIQKTDRLLYRAKNTGKGKIVYQDHT